LLDKFLDGFIGRNKLGWKVEEIGFLNENVTFFLRWNILGNKFRKKNKKKNIFKMTSL
jgi:hypothetical protein